MANIIALSTPYPPTQNLPFHHHTYLTARLIFPSKMAPNNPGNPNNPTDPAPVEVDTQARNLKAKTIPLDPFLTGLDSRSPRVTLPTVTNSLATRLKRQTTGYLLPNDETESDRLDMVHEMVLTMMNRELFLAPIKNPQRVIDLGTGTGIWAMDFGMLSVILYRISYSMLTTCVIPADRFPSAEASTITPLSDLELIEDRVPPNLKFVVDDIEAEWGYDVPFDFIHARYAKPGGWVEFQDWNQYPYSEDGSLKGTTFERYFNEMVGAFYKNGYEGSPGPHLEQWFREAGFVDIHVHKYRAPMGTWPKDPYYKKIGTWMMLQGDQAYEAGAMAVLTRNEAWSKEEVAVLAAKTKEDAHNRNIHALFDFYVVYGRKPE
ncbi:Methyltransferase [Rasamsonia emersonii CBS 393.64]|uniref:Methyltransferase n=1 Tax=Rasamsonia emersonii (strain ATCC 16479 / CBS 393.64 / IMI 116815) TaxID=1408163 RepID=A0A0F4YDN7_RASE3|nr:Methyltransferase [Rasamsonia emersonii CBS 393.64]KKA16274.1 Methyltransferase [Rasamsonia emersonii CBS 393.64]